MDRSAFYASLRARNSGVFGTSLSQSQVDGMEALLDEAQRRGEKLPFLAYCLATTYHETAHTMQPIYEKGQRSYFNKYEPGTKIGKVLGNTQRGDGFLFRGRGDVQLTGRRNYTLASKKLGIDLITNPDRALEPTIAATILYEGMDEGWFTGRDLDDFIDDFDEDDAEDLREFVKARYVINGTDKAETIGKYALAFEKALRAAAYVSQAPKTLTIPPPAPVEAPKPVPAPVDAPKAQPAPVPVSVAPEASPHNAIGIIAAIALAGGAVWQWGHDLTAWLASHWPF